MEVSKRLRQMVHESIPGVEERIQYKKPHFLKNGHYAAVMKEIPRYENGVGVFPLPKL
ncbi:DUF1801 domain-containing protein [Brevibacillus invocatus]|uniref:DUF1801 domain-containing protein n=2 Tax=Brevibacillus TaxID=55080 RepID=A0A3M8BWI6_9BACL|nr:DUF1801 domain-containing protein [Brevibacillus invocatus]RNB67810.1 DUF1801 domain-containing protein [Brevibacillus invocatus]